MRKALSLMLTFCLALFGFGQAAPEDWANYVADYDGKPGSVIVNLGLKEWVKQFQYPVRISFNIPLQPCRPDGFPTEEALEAAKSVEDLIVDNLKKKNSMIVVAGSFMHNCSRRLYIYTSIATEMDQIVYQTLKGVSKEKVDLKVVKEEKWDAYHQFLFPNRYTMQQVQNNRVIAQLLQAQDNPQKERMLEHLLLFKQSENRTKAKQELVKIGFKVLTEEFSSGYYQLQIGKVSPLFNVHEQSYALINVAEKFSGLYDGWQCSPTR